MGSNVMTGSFMVEERKNKRVSSLRRTLLNAMSLRMRLRGYEPRNEGRQMLKTQRNGFF